MADSRRAWAKALFLALGEGVEPDRAEAAREIAALALEAVSAVLKGAAAAPARARAAGMDAARAEAFFLDPAIPREAKAEALASLYGEGGPKEGREVFARFAAFLVEKGRVGLIPAIARSYRLLLDRESGIERAELLSARPLPEATVSGIADAWKTASGANRVELRIVQDPALLGGFILRTDSVRYDWSVAGRFKRLGQELSRPINEGRE